jgi:hypothetical protein
MAGVLEMRRLRGGRPGALHWFGGEPWLAGADGGLHAGLLRLLGVIAAGGAQLLTTALEIQPTR